MDNLEQFFGAMLDDIIDMDEDWNITTSNGKKSPIEELFIRSYDRQYEDFTDAKDQEGTSFTEEEAHSHAFHFGKEEAYYYLVENITGNDAIAYLDEELHSCQWIDFNQITPQTNLFQYIGLLPLPWVHENIIKNNYTK